MVSHLIIATRVVNAGLGSGNVSVVLSDIEGKGLATRTIALDGGKWELIEWDIEAWATGDIEIIVSLENYSQSQSLLIEDVKEFESKQQDLDGYDWIGSNFPYHSCRWVLIFLSSKSETIRAVY